MERQDLAKLDFLLSPATFETYFIWIFTIRILIGLTLSAELS